MKYLRVILIVLLLGCCTLWVASYWNISWNSRDGLNVVALWDGAFVIERYDFDIGVYGLTTGGYDGLHTFWWPAIMVITASDLWAISCSLWLPTLLLALSLAIPASPWARRRAKQGLCIRCGYDLSGTEHEACPECGEELATGDSP